VSQLFKRDDLEKRDRIVNIVKEFPNLQEYQQRIESKSVTPKKKRNKSILPKNTIEVSMRELAQTKVHASRQVRSLEP
jgi:hypothetical protein